MKKVNFGAIALAASLAMVACQPQESLTPDAPTVKISVDADVKPLANTKSYITPDYQVHWNAEGEAMRLIVPGVSNTASTGCTVTEGDTKAQFSFSLPTGEPNTTIYGVYPALAATESADLVQTLTIPTEQYATVDSYASTSYLAVTDPIVLDLSGNANVQAHYNRITALNKLTLKGVNDEISSVEITLPAGTNAFGARQFNLESKEVSGDASNAVKVIYPTALPAAEENVIWFTSWDVALDEGAQLEVKVKGKNGTYTKTITANAKGIAFKVNYLNTLTINMASAEQHPAVVYMGLAETKDELNIEEKTAVEWMLANVPGSQYVSFTNIADADLSECKVIWWHFHSDVAIDNMDKFGEYASAAVNAAETVKTLYENGTSLLLTRFATAYVSTLGVFEMPNNCWGGAEDSGDKGIRESFFVNDGRAELPLWGGIEFVVDEWNTKVLTGGDGYTFSNSNAKWNIHENWVKYQSQEAWLNATQSVGGKILATRDEGDIVAWEFAESGNGKIVNIGDQGYDWYSPTEVSGANYHGNVEKITSNAINYLLAK